MKKQPVPKKRPALETVYVGNSNSKKARKCKLGLDVKMYKQPRTVQKWEYLEISMEINNHASINTYGKDGWELVSTLRNKEGRVKFYFFKRPL